MALHIAAGFGLGGNESYPRIFQPFGGFAEGVPAEQGRVRIPEAPGISKPIPFSGSSLPAWPFWRPCRRQRVVGILDGMELIFEVRDAEEGGFCARALGHAIFTEAETWEELRANVLEATTLHFEDGLAQPRLIQLHYVKDELIPVEAA